MAEYSVHHHVDELINLLNIRETDTVGADVYADMLIESSQKPRVPSSFPMLQIRKKVSEKAPERLKFLEKYEELKNSHTVGLNRFVCFLSELCDDQDTLEFLRENEEKARASTIVEESYETFNIDHTNLPLPDLDELKDELRKAQGTTRIFKEIHLVAPQKKRVITVPDQPDWLFTRSGLTMDYVHDIAGHTDEDLPVLGSLPLTSQEKLVIADLLFLLEGVEGSYILPKPLSTKYSNKEFTVDSSLDPSLSELTQRILPLCSYYSTVVRFIEEKSAYEYGLVNHALAAAMRSLIKDYNLLVAQLEHENRQGRLALQKLWFYLQPTIKTFEILASIANSINNGKCIGDTVLTLLHEMTSGFAGDSKSQELCLFLTQAACAPYFEILEMWIYKGIINDPYEEFFVVENEEVNKEKSYNEYWEQNYVIRKDRTPVFLVQVVQEVLNTGKYLNVVRQCGRDVKCPYAEEMIYTLNEKGYFDQIEKAHNYASKVLLNLLMEEQELMARLRSMKHYFLLDKGDFIVQFMDMTEEEMKQPYKNISRRRMETLLELALRTSTANVDPFKDDLRIQFQETDLISQLYDILKAMRSSPIECNLSGLESFSFNYNVKWPLTLVLNRKALMLYQLLFRQLFYCKHVERQLCNLWLQNKCVKLPPSKGYTAAFALRQRMLNFVQNLEYYLMVEVIEPNWHIFLNKMETVSNIDDVLLHHGDFLHNCLKEGMMTNVDLLRIIHKLMVVCITFCNRIRRFNESLEGLPEKSWLTLTNSLQATNPEDPQKYKISKKVVAKAMDEESTEHLGTVISMFEANFNKLLTELMVYMIHGNGEHSLLCRLNFNGFYTNHCSTFGKFLNSDGTFSFERSGPSQRASNSERSNFPGLFSSHLSS
ncbi:gamma-tubulin complex component 2-like [Argonauta hians]